MLIDKINLTLFLPSRILGGAERQFINIANLLSTYRNINLTVIDSSKQHIIKRIKSNNVKKIVAGSKKVKVKNSVLLTTANYAFCIKSMVDIEETEVKFLFLSHYNLPHVYLSYFLPKPLSTFFKYIFIDKYRRSMKLMESSLIFNDQDIKSFYENFYDIELNSDLMGLKYDLAIPNEVENKTSYENIITWIGRLDKPSSFYAIEKIIYDISTAKNLGKNFKFQIIGDGDNKKKLLNIVENHNLRNIIKFEGHIDYEELPKKLKKTKVLFANGTSVYEGIKSNIPVVVFDLLRESDVDHKYLYSFYSERPDGILGKTISNFDENIDGHSFEEILRISNSSQREIIVKNSYEKALKILNKGSDSIKQQFLTKQEICPSELQQYILDALFFKFRNLIKDRNEENTF